MILVRNEDIRMVLIALFAMMMLGLQAAPRATAATQSDAAPNAEVSGDIDVQRYRIDAELVPDSNTLKASATVTFRVLKASQSATFELNGSLRVSAVRAADGRPLPFTQDTLNELNVRIDLGQLVAAGADVTLTIDYAGQLVTSEGGPLPDKRLAYVGPEGAYLHYASRWFPFREYGADRATMELKLTMPSSWKLAAHGEPFVQSPPVVVTPAPAPASAPAPTRRGQRPAPAAKPAPPVSAPVQRNPNLQTVTIAETSPVLPGSIAAAPYLIVPVLSSMSTSVEVYALPGGERAAEQIAEEAADILDFYSQTFGPYAFGKRFVIAQIDDQALPSMNGAGVLMLSSETLRRPMDSLRGDLARDIAVQWWGQAVGLKNFDQVWMSLGLAQYSSILYRSKDASAASVDAMLSELGESALSYESEASITQAPSQLNDQTPAFRSVVMDKGAYVFHMLRMTIGDEKFYSLVRDLYARERGRNVTIAGFEKQVSAVAGQDMRWFFGLWVDSTGVPEFSWDYSVLRTAAGGWRVRGTLRQSIEGLRMPVDVLVSSAGGDERLTLRFDGSKAADFVAEPKGGQPTLIVDPDRKILRSSDTIRVAVVVRRGIQEMEQNNYVEAESKLRDALKLAPRSSWAAYNLGQLYMKQGNSQKAIDAFTQALNGDLEPRWLEVWSYLFRGNAYDALGQRERAVAEYDKAIETGNDYDGAQAAAMKYKGEPYRMAAQ